MKAEELQEAVKLARKYIRAQENEDALASWYEGASGYDYTYKIVAALLALAEENAQLRKALEDAKEFAFAVKFNVQLPTGKELKQRAADWLNRHPSVEDDVALKPK